MKIQVRELVTNRRFDNALRLLILSILGVIIVDSFVGLPLGLPGKAILVGILWGATALHLLRSFGRNRHKEIES